MNNLAYSSDTTAEAIDAALAGAQDPSLIQAVELIWASTGNLPQVAQVAWKKFNPQLLELATALRAVSAGAGGIDEQAFAQALGAANPAWQANAPGVAAAMLRAVPGMYPRRFFGDLGNRPAVPNNGVYSSPDLIIAGTAQWSDPARQLATWNDDPSVQPQAGVTNFVYVRGLNLYPGFQQGNVYLYRAPGNIVNNPSAWSPVTTASGHPYVPIQSDNTGDIWTTAEPFAWIPDAGQHTCLIARVETEQYPNPLPQGTINPADWVTNSPAVSWRNYDPIAGLQGARSDLLAFGNTGASDDDFVIAAVARNVPPGVTVRLHSDAGAARFDTGATAIGRARQEITAQVRLPAGFWGQLQVAIANPGPAPLPPEASIDIRCYRKVAPGTTPFALPAPAQDLRQGLGAGNDTRHLQLVGSFAFGGNGHRAG